jgi:hypothetical protein
MFLSSELIGGDLHALGGAHFKLRGRHFRIKPVHEWNRLSVEPAVADVGRSGEEDGADGVDHAFEHHQEHAARTLFLVKLVAAHLVAVGLKAASLLCCRKAEKKVNHNRINTMSPRI